MAEKAQGIWKRKFKMNTSFKVKYATFHILLYMQLMATTLNQMLALSSSQSPSLTSSNESIQFVHFWTNETNDLTTEIVPERHENIQARQSNKPNIYSILLNNSKKPLSKRPPSFGWTSHQTGTTTGNKFALHLRPSTVQQQFHSNSQWNQNQELHNHLPVIRPPPQSDPLLNLVFSNQHSPLGNRLNSHVKPIQIKKQPPPVTKTESAVVKHDHRQPTASSWCSEELINALEPVCRCVGQTHNRAIACFNSPRAQLLRRALMSAAILLQNDSATQLERLQIVNCSLSVERLETVLPSTLSFQTIVMQKTSLRSPQLRFLSSSADRLRSLSLAHNELPTFPFPSACTKFERLQRLNLRYNHIRSVAEYGLKNCNRLTHLDLSFNRISHVGAFAFAGAILLKELRMKANHLKVINNFAFARIDQQLYGPARLNLFGSGRSKQSEMDDIQNLTSTNQTAMESDNPRSMFDGIGMSIREEIMNELKNESLTMESMSSSEPRKGDRKSDQTIEQHSILIVDLSANSIKHIADGAFDLLRTRVLDLSENQLRQLEQKHFAPILQSMRELETENVINNEINERIRKVLEQIQQNTLQQLLKLPNQQLLEQLHAASSSSTSVRPSSSVWKKPLQTIINKTRLPIIQTNEPDNQKSHPQMFQRYRRPSIQSYPLITKISDQPLWNQIPDWNSEHARPNELQQQESLIETTDDDHESDSNILFDDREFESNSLNELYARMASRARNENGNVLTEDEEIIPHLNVAGNPFVCDCEQTRWLVQLTDSRKQLISGFQCIDMPESKHVPTLMKLHLNDIGC